jgi:2-keto-4-pentenoate hydratase/2-oxohepta-3-ene-1,7-dioic acid hydratase in catechol pathway
VKAADALDFVAGVLPLNDVTARELQRKDSQWARAKGFDTFCPIGEVVPFDPEGLNGLSVITTVNGEERQRGRAVDQVFPLQYVLQYVTAFMTLEAGDIIATGAPAGVGPLSDGDVVRVEIPGVGAVESPVVAEAEE